MSDKEKFLNWAAEEAQEFDDWGSWMKYIRNDPSYNEDWDDDICDLMDEIDFEEPEEYDDSEDEEEDYD